VTTRMWEVRAADGRVEDLLRWALEAVADRPAEVYRGAGSDAGRVVVLLADGSDLPEPPAGLAARRAGSWLFDRVG
jgi:hypothetical protein